MQHYHTMRTKDNTGVKDLNTSRGVILRLDTAAEHNTYKYMNQQFSKKFFFIYELQPNNVITN